MKWRVERAAQLELEEAAAWYEAQRKGLSAEFLDEFERGVGRVAEFPLAWKSVGSRTRQYRFNRFPYGIIYQVREDEILIVAVAHLRRRPGYWRDRIDSNA
jgi:plasmid stabilization system protein ParE